MPCRRYPISAATTQLLAARCKAAARVRLRCGCGSALSYQLGNLEKSVPSRRWWEFEGGVISGLSRKPKPALERRRRSRHDERTDPFRTDPTPQPSIVP